MVSAASTAAGLVLLLGVLAVLLTSEVARQTGRGAPHRLGRVGAALVVLLAVDILVRFAVLSHG